jgi:hypothetical protein
MTTVEMKVSEIKPKLSLIFKDRDEFIEEQKQNFMDTNRGKEMYLGVEYKKTKSFFGKESTEREEIYGKPTEEQLENFWITGLPWKYTHHIVTSPYTPYLYALLAGSVNYDKISPLWSTVTGLTASRKLQVDVEDVEAINHLMRGVEQRQKARKKKT